MENDETEVIETELDTETTENEVDIEIDEPEETVEDLKKKLATAEAQKDHWKKKATKEVAKPTESKTDITSRDLYALMNAKVEQEDVEEVVKAAKLLGKTIQEALNDDTVKAILRTREGYRKTAEATSTKSSRPGSKTVSVDEIVSKASKGEFPEKGSKEADDLFWARRGGRR